MERHNIEDLLAYCSRCGKCRTVCPIFQEMPAESYVARGKVQLYKAIRNGYLEPSARYRELFSYCLLCGLCTQNCPNEVDTPAIVLQARQEWVQKKGLPFIKRNVFQNYLNNQGKITFGAKLLYQYQKRGVQKAFQRLHLLPRGLREKESLLPQIEAQPLRKLLPTTVVPAGKVKGRVGYFTGCLSQYVFTQTGIKLVKTLNQAGIEVIMPEQVCCGMPALSAGDKPDAVQMAKFNTEAFKAAGVDTVITDCATCGSMVKKKYPVLLEEDLPFKVYDISEFLIRSINIHDLKAVQPRKVTYHDPCHLNRYMGVKEEPRELLKRMPGIELAEMQDPARCCGASGSFQLEHRQLSAAIGRHKAADISGTEADVVVTGCPSCRLQLERVLAGQDENVLVMHPLDLVW